MQRVHPFASAAGHGSHMSRTATPGGLASSANVSAGIRDAHRRAENDVSFIACLWQ